ncbi:DUF1146 domain-containing protein [Thermoflavimicrobium dichotomicum]|uniref:Conserved hypothetical integral membrane protein n=1 Tax=Thermoflavimicrobium dichotomicum TaxID=46223 RepID=A0A1I3K0R4_9BACL|nr:DUF1146 domain-containing protein [Thermoflavimicrobium dichotomicum]SFI66072.1 conserved hypothetical integral membrane protein [Thermoflavimicrobium dichotomicum]
MDGATHLAITALINIILSISSILFCWSILSNIRIDKWIQTKKPFQIRVLMLLLSIIFGHQLATFFIDYLDWTRMITELFV